MPRVGTTTERGYGADWQRARVRALQRDRGLCVACLQAGRVTPAREVDHIVPLVKGGTHAVDNLQALCIPCHRDKTAADEGWSIRVQIGADGWPMG